MIRTLMALMLLATPALAADPVGVAGEQPVSLTGTVVDLLCAVARQCAPACGAGMRQLGLLTVDGRLVPAVKSATLFAGATADLLPYCGRQVTVDGVLARDHGSTIYMVQYIRPQPGTAWAPAEAFQNAWAKAAGVPAGSPDADRWFRQDPAVATALARRGRLGLGAQK